jgi:hypothetical protein
LYLSICFSSASTSASTSLHFFFKYSSIILQLVPPFRFKRKPKGLESFVLSLHYGGI